MPRSEASAATDVSHTGRSDPVTFLTHTLAISDNWSLAFASAKGFTALTAPAALHAVVSALAQYCASAYADASAPFCNSRRSDIT